MKSLISRVVIMIVLVGLPPAVSCFAAAPVPATQPSPGELHAKAIELMGQELFAKARVPLEQAYNATPAAQRTRPLVLNRAIVDIATKSNAMRAVRELGDYLKLHRDPDVAATDILGAALNLTARDPKLKAGALWQSAFKEWDRRNFELDESRPGYHRFGAKWLDEQDYLDLQAQRKDLTQAIEDQQVRADHATWAVGAAKLRVDQAQGDLNYYRNAVMDDAYLPGLTTADRLRGRQRAAQLQAQLNDPTLAARGQAAANNGYTQQTSVAAQQAVLDRAIQEYNQSQRDEAAERRELSRLQSAGPQPDWPTKFDPVDIAELTPPPIPPPDPKAVEAAAKEKNDPAAGWGVFGDPGAPVTPAAGAPAANMPTTRPGVSAPPTQNPEVHPPRSTATPLVAPPTPR